MSATRTTIIAMLVVVLTFGAGFAVGLFTGHMTALRIFRPERLPEFATRAMVRRLDRRLDLTDAQRTQITDIINRRHRAISEVRGSLQPKIRAEINKANEEISRVLTPEQQKKFEDVKLRLGGHHRLPWHR